MHPNKEGFHPLIMIWAGEVIIHSNSLICNLVDPKVLFSATRPKKVQAYMNFDRFLSVWIDHLSAFEKEPPEIAFSYASMPLNSDGLAMAIPIRLNFPRRKNSTSFECELTFPEQKIDPGKYVSAAFFIDWLPSSICPKPVELLFPESVL